MEGTSRIALFIEAGNRRVFASALDWPGWARGGKTEELAIATLADYLPRYAAIVTIAGFEPPSLGPDGAELAVTERQPGVAKNADFGSLGEIADSDRAPLPGQDGARLAALLEAAWSAFDRTSAAAPALLRKGPRGGGRDTGQIIGHVLEAEVIYARKMGLQKDKSGAGQDAAAALRQRIGAALRAPDSLVTPPNGWPPRYAARRMAWHVLDHLWEIEDKSEPG
jgi:hypothetical protein